MGECAGLRASVGAERAGRLGPVSRRQLGLGALLRLDLGGLRALGMGSIPLRSLAMVERRLGMVAGTGVGCGILSSVLGAGVRFVLWLRRWLGIRFWLGRLGRVRLAATRAL